jgi:Ankyrin repeat
MHASLESGDVFKSPNNLSSALLTGLTDAYGDQVDDTGLTKYYEELTAVLIQRDSNYEAALQVHARWVQIRRTNEGRVDKHVALVDEYVYAVCYLNLGQHARAEPHCLRALELAEETRTDKTWLACLHIAAILELRKGKYTSAFRHICKAGALAYAEDNNAGYVKEGSIAQILFTIGCFAMGIFEDEDVVPRSKQPILIAVQAQLQFPAQLTDKDQGREKRKPSQIIQELVAAAAEVLGPARTIIALAQLGSSPTKFLKGDKMDDIAWVALEKQLFAEATAPLHRESSLAQFSPGVQNAEQAKTERELRRTPTDSIAPIQRTLSFEIEDAAEVGKSMQAKTATEQDTDSWLPALHHWLKLYSSVRDPDQRTILWHVSGGQQCDLSAFTAFGIKPEDLPAELLTVEISLPLVKFLLESEANHTLFDKDGRTAFMRAVETGSFDIADLFLDHGADQDSKSFVDETALHEAIQRQDPLAVNYCICHGCSLVVRNLNGETALAMAVRRDSTEICTLLLRAGANPLTRDYIGRGCLRLALEYEQYDNFKACIKTLHGMPTDEFMDVLLDYGYTNVSLNEIITEAQSFDQDILELVKECSDIPADLTRRDKAGVTFYHHAAWKFTPEQVYNIFVRSGADWTIQEDCYGLMVLHLAAVNSNPMGMMAVLMNEGNVEDNVQDRIMNKKAVEMIMWTGFTMELGAPDSDFHHEFKIDAKKSLSMKYFVSWVKQCRLRYIRPLSEEEVEELVDFRRTLAFGPPEGSEGFNARILALQNAIIDIAYGSQAAENPRSSTAFASRAAELLHNGQKMWTGMVDDDTSDEMCELRWSFPWRFNPSRWPHVFYMDRNGKCQFTEPLFEREDSVYRVWVVDEYGLVKGVLGAVAL